MRVMSSVKRWTKVDRRPPAREVTDIRLGLRANLGQFASLVAINALVGGMVGEERTVVPLLATDVFGLAALSSALTFIVAFGLTKAVTNLAAGTLSDRYGRKPVLVAGWLVGIPAPLLLIWGPDWSWVIVANVLLGINQGLTWSTTVIMKIDLVGPARRGLAMGLNEAAGYGALALTAFATGLIAERWGLRPAPFLLGLAFAGLGLGLSAILVRETRGHATLEAADRATTDASGGARSIREVFGLTTLREPALSAASQAGLVNNLNDGLAWGLLPIFYATAGLSVGEIGLLAGTYPAVWCIGQLLTGGLSDRIGRKGLIVTGMLLQAGALAVIVTSVGLVPWLIGAVLLGAGTAMVYPTLLAVIGDVAHPVWRASAVGVYRLWRDLGFAIGAVLAGVIADRLGIPAAIWVVAALTAASGIVVLLRMYESHPARRITPRQFQPRDTEGGTR
jgi:MFS family permease